MKSFKLQNDGRNIDLLNAKRIDKHYPAIMRKCLIAYDIREENMITLESMKGMSWHELKAIGKTLKLKYLAQKWLAWSTNHGKHAKANFIASVQWRSMDWDGKPSPYISDWTSEHADIC